MGGLGSGMWHRWAGKKSTVEESLTLEVKQFRGRLHPYSSGTFVWMNGWGRQAWIDFSVAFRGETPVVTLQYRCGGEEIRIPIRMQTSPTQFGGRRWWFTCPLIVSGVPCGRRVGKLYSPPQSRYFGCRTCHQLTYRSCQKAHQEERLTGSIDGLFKYLNVVKRREGIE